MSKQDLQRAKTKLVASLERMSGHMGTLDAHMDKTEQAVEKAARAGHDFLGEIDECAAMFVAELSGSNGPEGAVNQPDLAPHSDAPESTDK